jgi:hypothetical protein
MIGRDGLTNVILTIGVLGLLLTLTACGGGFETVVVNNSTRSFVVEAVDPSVGGLVRYYHQAPGSTVLIDTVEDLDGVQGLNRAIESVTLFDGECMEVMSVPGDFSRGGVITVDANGTASFEPGRTGSFVLVEMRGPNESAGSEETCEAAAAKL